MKKLFGWDAVLCTFNLFSFCSQTQYGLLTCNTFICQHSFSTPCGNTELSCAWWCVCQHPVFSIQFIFSTNVSIENRNLQYSIGDLVTLSDRYLGHITLFMGILGPKILATVRNDLHKVHYYYRFPGMSTDRGKPVSEDERDSPSSAVCSTCWIEWESLRTSIKLT